MNLRNLLLAIAAIVVLGGGYVLFQPAAGPKASAATGPKVFALSVGKRAGGPAELPVLRAEQGDTVALEITSTTEGVLSIHGYRQDTTLSTREMVRVEFAADRGGRFPMHVHASDGAHLDVGVLQVEPRAAAAR